MCGWPQRTLSRLKIRSLRTDVGIEIRTDHFVVISVGVLLCKELLVAWVELGLFGVFPGECLDGVHGGPQGDRGHLDQVTARATKHQHSEVARGLPVLADSGVVLVLEVLLCI